jgi:Spy/CpxP family protein refolding chaperone
MRRFRDIILAVALSVATPAAALADSTPPAGLPTEDGLRAFALQWFAQMQVGRIDRTQYTTAYGAQLTDDAVQAMSHHLNEYGAPPIRAEIMDKRSRDNQTFYKVKLLFPRGDAASLLFGFDVEGKITGVAIMSMAGD